MAWRCLFGAGRDLPLTSTDIDRLIEALRSLHKESYIEKIAVLEALKNYGEFNFLDGETGIKVDFWILQKSPFDVSRLQRRVAKKILNSNVYFISPEDLIISKLLWYKKSRSSRHLEDVESIFTISGSLLDMSYVKKWAKNLGIEKFLKNFFGETKL